MIRKLRFFCFILLPAGLLLSVTSPVFYFEEAEQFSCVNYEFNIVENTTALENYHIALDQLIEQKKDKVRIAHIGDSHIQADYLTNVTRKKLQKLYGNGGRGYLFPYRLIRSNNPPNIRISREGEWSGCTSTSYRTHCNFGLCGASATTYDSTATLKINPNRWEDMNYEFNQLDLFHFGHSNEMSFRLLDSDSSALDVDIQKESESVSSVHFTEYQDSLWLGFEKLRDRSYAQLFGMSFENDHPGLIYDAIGLNGAHVASYLRNQFFDEQLKLLEPDLIIITLGTNDGYMSGSRFCSGCFKNNYSKLLSKVREHNPNASIMLTTPGDYYRRRRYHDSHQRSIVRAIRELAVEHQAAIWDYNRIMGGDYSIKAWLRQGLARKDLIHYTEKGYKLQGELLFDALMKSKELHEDPSLQGAGFLHRSEP